MTGTRLGRLRKSNAILLALRQGASDEAVHRLNGRRIADLLSAVESRRDREVCGELRGKELPRHAGIEDAWRRHRNRQR